LWFSVNLDGSTFCSKTSDYWSVRNRQVFHSLVNPSNLLKKCFACIHFKISISIHPSIFYTPLIRWSVHRGAGAYRSSHRVRGGEHPGQIASPSQRQRTTHTHSLLRTILETPINLTCMFLDSGREPEYPERTNTYTGRTCKLHTERPQPGVEPGTLWLQGNGVNRHTTDTNI